MSGITGPCPSCGVSVTVMCGSLPGLCNKCYWERNPQRELVENKTPIVRPPGSVSPDGRDFEVYYQETADAEWTLDYRFRYLEQAEGRARALLSYGKHSVKIMQVIDYDANG